jgi:hypothetical protein
MEIVQTQVSESSGVEPSAREYFDEVFGVYDRLRSSWGFPVRDGSYPDTLAVVAFESGPCKPCSWAAFSGID